MALLMIHVVRHRTARQGRSQASRYPARWRAVIKRPGEDIFAYLFRGSQDCIAWSVASFRAGPGDISEGVLDLTGFAVETIGRIQFKPFFLGVLLKLYFIHIARTKPGAGGMIRLKTFIDA